MSGMTRQEAIRGAVMFARNYNRDLVAALRGEKDLCMWRGGVAAYAKHCRRFRDKAMQTARVIRDMKEG